MDEKRVKKLVEHWMKTVERDIDTVDALFQAKRYPEALFWGHLVIEKTLKAFVIEFTHEEAPKIHDLVKLKELANLRLSEEDMVLLDKLSDFNLEARYPEFKLKAFNLASKDFTAEQIQKIKNLYQRLCQQLKQKI